MWGSRPDSFIFDILKYKQSGSVLDLGVGYGRNALFLAKKGFNVMGVDKSESEINKFKEFANKYKLKVNTVVSSIEKFKFKKKYDIILSVATLHFLPRESIANTISKIKNSTKTDGFNAIIVFTEANPDKRFPYLFKKNELKNFYRDWEIIKYKEFLTPFEKHGERGEWHKHGVAELVARKVRNKRFI